MNTNMALTRLRKEFDMIKNYPNDSYTASPIKDDMFTWHFTIRGPEDTEFDGGIYHGVIKLPTSYPIKPPSIMFLTPNGRFDTNMDVCLSFTRYHKEEWQAAWTIGTMLNAIISFFPVKENHDSIGSIDYPVEARKKIAVNSKKWTCDQCGPIISLIPDKKPKPEIIPQVEVENEALNVSEKEEKDDHSGMSDISSPLNRAVDTPTNEGKAIKQKEKTPKLKKMELDKKSHISNIEGVIFEDLNEDENEEEYEKNLENMRLNSEEIKFKAVTNDKDDIQVINRAPLKKSEIESKKGETHYSDTNLNTIEADTDNSNNLRRNHSDINHPENFSDYFKQLRQTQFEGEKEINGNSKQKSLLEKIKEHSGGQETFTLIKTDDEIYFHDDSIKIKTNQDSKLKNAIRPSTNYIEEVFTNECDLSNVIKSIKCHKSISHNEILDEHFTSIQNDYLKEKNNEYMKYVCTSLLRMEQKLNENKAIDTNYVEKSNYVSKLSEMNNKELEEMMLFLQVKNTRAEVDEAFRKNNNMDKYFTRSKYKMAKSKRLDYLNLAMIIILFTIMGAFFLCHKYL